MKSIMMQINFEKKKWSTKVLHCYNKTKGHTEKEFNEAYSCVQRRIYYKVLLHHTSALV